jgi:hypothetical protein
LNYANTRDFSISKFDSRKREDRRGRAENGNRQERCLKHRKSATRGQREKSCGLKLFEGLVVLREENIEAGIIERVSDE